MSNGDIAVPAKIKRVVVMGSKPNSIVPSGDIIYCANAAAQTDPVAVGKFPRRTVVASGPVIARSITTNGQARTYEEKRAQSVCSFDGQEAIIFMDHGHPRFKLLHDELTKSGPPNRAIHFIGNESQRALVRLFAGSYPVLNRQFFNQPRTVVFRDALKVAMAFLNLKWVNSRLGSPKYRPSTGVLALLLAIREHGRQAQYVLSGVGLGNRYVHVFDGKPIEVRRAPKRDVPQHVVADMIVLQRLAKRFNICTTEVELEDILPIVKF